jgi:hypothetical protein
LQREAESAISHGSAETFAKHLASSLTRAIARIRFKNESDGGLGLHFTAYERIEGYWVPELFQIRNWVDEQYTSVNPNGFEVSRETYGAAIGSGVRSKDDGSTERRLIVHKRLHDESILFRFVNGDPAVFNTVATATFEVFKQLRDRGSLGDQESVATHLAMVRRPVEMVSDLLVSFCSPDKRRIGGKAHDIAVRPGPTYQSTTGDG